MARKKRTSSGTEKIKKDFQPLKNGAVMKMIVYNNGLGASNHLYRPITKDDLEKGNIDLDGKTVTDINELGNGDHTRKVVSWCT